MNKYLLKPSRLANYPYLCMDISMDHLDIRDSTVEFCCESFGSQGTKHQGRWYNGLLGFYFSQRDDAVQFILTWG